MNKRDQYFLAKAYYQILNEDDASQAPVQAGAPAQAAEAPQTGPDPKAQFEQGLQQLLQNLGLGPQDTAALNQQVMGVISKYTPAQGNAAPAQGAAPSAPPAQTAAPTQAA